MKKRKKITIIATIIVTILILIYYCCNKIKVVTTTGEVISLKEIIKTQILNYIDDIIDNKNFKITENSDKPYITNKQKYIVTLETSGVNNLEEFQIEWGIDDKSNNSKLEEKTELKFDITEEGKNKCFINIINTNKEKVFTWEKDIYYIQEYEKQFLDELEKHGVSDYFMWMDIDKELETFRYSGEKIIRSDIRQSTIEESGYILFDRTIPKMIENDYKIIGILGGFTENFFKRDGKVTCQEDLDKFLKYA